MSKGVVTLALVALAFSGGCIVHSHHPHGGPPGHARGTVHAHDHECGHYFLDGVWVSVPVGHVHAAGCGHVRVGGVWHGVRVKVKG
jgi:hypothetical protein